MYGDGPLSCASPLDALEVCQLVLDSLLVLSVAFKGRLGLGCTDLSEVRKHVLNVRPDEGQVDLVIAPPFSIGETLVSRIVDERKFLGKLIDSADKGFPSGYLRANSAQEVHLGKVRTVCTEVVLHLVGEVQDRLT